MSVAALAVFSVLFAVVTVLGFAGARWRPGNLDLLHEWALAGRRFGTLVSWFLIGGDLYTAYTFIAVPALVYGEGAYGFFTLPYTAIAYPIVFVFAPRFWTIAKHRGYITYADFVRERFDSRSLSLAVALTGLLATMPYIALQLVGIQVVLKALGLSTKGLTGDLPLIVAFLILAAYTYRGGLRAPALVAIVKDVLIYTTVIVAVIVIPAKLGGYGHIFSSAGSLMAARSQPANLILSPHDYSAYVTLAVGSALALFMYPHSMTSLLSASSAAVIRRNMALLPVYSLLLAVMATFGYMAVAAGLAPANTSDVVPQLFAKLLPNWFAGFAFAAIAIGALVPAAIMSIAAANLFTRNIYREFINPHCTSLQESRNAKLTSLIVKVGALIFVLFVPVGYAINFQLLAGSWILQTFPPIVLGLYTRWFHRRALLLGWLTGMTAATVMIAGNHFHSVFTMHMGSMSLPGFTAIYALVVNLAVAAAATVVLDALHVNRGSDRTNPADYEERAGMRPELVPSRMATSS